MTKTLLFLLLLTSTVVFAADEEDSNTSKQNASTQEEPQANSQASTQTPDSFKPTETLSKDVPAIFPADI
ncbi:MAG: hypothetical protein COB94_007380 [Gammaproteobacteria bacterium]|nr:hypothetical protein [Gammaproteobacteria bacterium]